MVDVIPVEVVKRAIAYYYLIAFCPTAKIDHFRDSSAPLRRRIVQESGMTETDFNKRASMYHKAVKHTYDNAYFVWLLNIEDIYGVSARINWSGRVDAKILVAEMKMK